MATRDRRPDQPAGDHRPRRRLRLSLPVFAALTLALVMAACLGAAPWSLGLFAGPGEPAPYSRQDAAAERQPPTWWPGEHETPDESAPPFLLLGGDHLGRDLFVRSLAGGAISLTIGLAATALAVAIGVAYGSAAALMGGWVDGLMMRIVDVLYGLPYMLIIVLLAVATDAMVERWQIARVAEAEEQRTAFVERAVGDVSSADPGAIEDARREALQRYGSGALSPTTRQAINVATLFIAIGSVSWLTMARVIRGQVLSLRAQPFMEASRAAGSPMWRQFIFDLLPNLAGPIVVYATLAAPAAILQESFLSFLGIGVKPPLPSWGGLAASGLSELNPYKSHWWLLVFPCALLAVTLLALNFTGEALRQAVDPKTSRSGRRR